MTTDAEFYIDILFKLTFLNYNLNRLLLIIFLKGFEHEY